MLIVVKWSWISISCDPSPSTFRPTQISLSVWVAQMKVFLRCYHCTKYENNMELLWKKWSDEIFMREMFPLEGPFTGYKHQFIAASWLCRSDGSVGRGVTGLGEFRLYVQELLLMAVLFLGEIEYLQFVGMSCHWQPTSEYWATVCAVSTERRYAPWVLTGGMRREY